MTACSGRKPPARTMESRTSSTGSWLAAVPCLVVNDEAHHTHDEESEWNKSIRRLHASRSGGLACATRLYRDPPPHQGTALLLDRVRLSAQAGHPRQIVKRPLKGVAKGIIEQRSEIASTRYQAYLTAGVERWREYRDQLAPLGKKPILFVMMNDTAEADDVGDWLRQKYPAEFGGDQLLIIHTNRSGDIVQEGPGRGPDGRPRRGRRAKPRQLHRQRGHAP